MNACRGDGELAVEIGGHGATRSLMRLLPHSEGRMQKVLTKCMLVIVSFCNASRTVVATNGGVELIIGFGPASFPFFVIKWRETGEDVLERIYNKAFPHGEIYIAYQRPR